MNRFFPTPRQRVTGGFAETGIAPAAAIVRPSGTGKEAARAYFSELASKFPMSQMIAAEWSQLTVPISPVPAAGQWLWRNMIDFDPYATLGQDIVVFGMWIDMLSTNPTPTNGATQLAWGTDTGLGAAIVIGDKQLPGSGDGAGTWTVGVAPIVGIDSSVTEITNSQDRRFFARTYPTGKLTTGTNKRGLNGAIVPFVRRITQGNRLRCAWALNRADVVAVGAAGKTIDGYTSVEIYYGLTKNPVDIAE